MIGSIGPFGVGLYLRGFSIEQTRDIRGHRSAGLRCVLRFRLDSPPKAPSAFVSGAKEPKSEAGEGVWGISAIEDPNTRRGS